jgi:sterol desaturase/sphingolipid hydroxylase (fatty acid hydroxylase superfamily)
MIMNKVVAVVTGSLLLLVIIFIGLLVERLNPDGVQPLKSVRFNLAYMLVHMLAQTIIIPACSLAAVVAVNAAGGGWIVPPAAGWMLLPAFLLYALVIDFFEYIFHRAQHCSPVMWAMHSFHHSDTALNASTTSRHYWAELGIKMMTIYLAAGMLFKTSALILGMYALLGFYNVFLHMNVRVGFGRWSMLMNSPQYHRIHHSALPEHFNCNFSALFPIFDLIFGTYRMPPKAEYPPTGLDSGEYPSGLIEAIFWPVSSRWHRGLPNRHL